MKIPQELIDQFARGNGAIFVGAGLSIGAGLPGWGQLMDRLSMELVDCPKQASYLDLAQYYVNEHRRNRLIKRLRDELDTTSVEPTTVHGAITQLGVSPIFTTNFDNLIEKSLLKAAVRFDKVIGEIDPNFWTNERTQLVKLHGDLDHPDSIVITSEDYERYINTHPAFVRTLTYALQTKTTLFLGYGANDIDIRSLLTLLQHESGEYARNAFSVMFDAHPTIIKDLDRRGIKVINIQIAIDTDKNKALSGWLNKLKQEIEKNSSINNSKFSKKSKNLPAEPYKFLNWFGSDDIAIFHGRDYEVESLINLISSQKVIVLYGESGTGKTSLLRAGALPRLSKDGFLISYLRPLTDPYKALDESLKKCLGINEFEKTDLLKSMQDNLPQETTLIIVIDQFEEFFIRQGVKVREKFIQILIDLIKNTANIRLILSLRSDYLDRLDELEAAIGRDPLKYRMRLQNLGPANASAAISEPARDFQIRLETTLLEKLLSDLEQGGIAPAQLQIVCFVLWQDWIKRNKPSTGLTYERYMELGSTQSILSHYLINVIRDLDSDRVREESGITLDAEKAQEAARVILKSVITSERTKIAVSGKEITQGEIVVRLKIPPTQGEALLLYLQNRRVIRHLSDTEYYELVHEVMIQQIWEWVTEEEKKTLDIQDLLARATTDYQKFRTLLSTEYLYLITEQAGNLKLNDDALELLLKSAITRNHQPEIWVERMDTNHAINILVQLLDSERKTLYPQIARALGITKSTKAIRYLDELLKDESREIQRSAAEAMGMLNPQSVAPPLFRAIMREHELMRVSPLIDTLEMLHNDDATAMLMLVASEHADPKVRNRATNAVVRLGHREGVRLLFQQIDSEDLLVANSAYHAVEGILQRQTADLLELYKNSDVEFRLTMIKKIKQISGQGFFSLMTLALHDHDPDVRNFALDTLVIIDDLAAIDLLVSLLKDETTELRKQAIVALGDLKDKRAVEPLIAILDDKDVELRKQAIVALGDLKDKRAVEPLIAILDDKDVELRKQAIVVLGDLKDKRAVEPLLALLHDDDLDVRQQAIIALGQTRDMRIVEPLLGLLNHENGNTRIQIISVLTQIDDNRVTKAVITALTSLADDLFLPQLIDNTLTAMDSSDADIRRRAVLFLGLLNDERVLKVLLEALRDRDMGVRHRAVSVLGQVKNERALKALLSIALTRGDPEMRRRAIASLGQVNDKRATEALLAALHDDDAEIRRLVIASLGKMNDERATEALLAALHGDDAEVRRLAIASLGKVNDERATEALLAALHGDDAEVRRLAIASLGQVNDERATEALLAALLDDDAEVRSRASKSLASKETK